MNEIRVRCHHCGVDVVEACERKDCGLDSLTRKYNSFKLDEELRKVKWYGKK